MSNRSRAASELSEEAIEETFQFVEPFAEAFSRYVFPILILMSLTAVFYRFSNEPAKIAAIFLVSWFLGVLAYNLFNSTKSDKL